MQRLVAERGVGRLVGQRRRARPRGSARTPTPPRRRPASRARPASATVRRIDSTSSTVMSSSRGDLGGRRLAAALGAQLALGAQDLVQLLDDVDGHADRARLVGERARDRLADPPRRVGRELEALAPVELLGGADEADRPLLDQVEERQALVAVALRDRDDEAQVRLDHLLLRAVVAALDPLRELDLLRGGQQVDLADVLQEELQRVGRELDGSTGSSTSSTAARRAPRRSVVGSALVVVGAPTSSSTSASSSSTVRVASTPRSHRRPALPCAPPRPDAELSHRRRTDAIGRPAHLALVGWSRLLPRRREERVRLPGRARSSGPSCDAPAGTRFDRLRRAGRSRRAAARGRSAPTGSAESAATSGPSRENDGERLSLSKRPTAAATCASSSSGLLPWRPARTERSAECWCPWRCSSDAAGRAAGSGRVGWNDRIEPVRG